MPPKLRPKSQPALREGLGKMIRLNRRSQAMIELTLAGALWGFGFVAATWALRGMGPLGITGWRFFIAAIVGVLLSLATSGRAHFNWFQFRLAAIPGFLISATLVLQTWGLRSTTATKSAFITTLYVLFVPIAERFFLRRKLPRHHLLYVTIAMFGVVLICNLHAAEPSFGDFLTLLCALAATVHILWFSLIADKIGPSFAFNNYQSIWAGAIPLVLSFVLEPAPRLLWSNGSWFGLLMLAFGSTLIAFALQVRAQKHIPPSLASLLFLMESPFSALFALTLLGEGLLPLQWLGGGLILLAAGLSTLFTVEAEELLPE